MQHQLGLTKQQNHLTNCTQRLVNTEDNQIEEKTLEMMICTIATYDVFSLG